MEAEEWPFPYGGTGEGKSGRHPRRDGVGAVQTFGRVGISTGVMEEALQVEGEHESTQAFLRLH